MRRSTLEHLPGTVTEIRYQRGHAGRYKHAFKPGVRQRVNRDGSVTLYHPSRRVWADDREAGFWRRYGHRSSNPGGSMDKNLFIFALIAGAVLLIAQSRVSPATQASLVQAPIQYWYDQGQVTFIPGGTLTPPSPTARPASQAETNAAGLTGYL